MNFIKKKSVNQSVTMRKMPKIFRRNKMPSRHTIYHLLNDSEETRPVGDRPKHNPIRTARSAVNITAAEENVQDNPSISIRQHAQKLNPQRTYLENILYKDLYLFPYRVDTRSSSTRPFTLQYIFQ